MKVKELIGYLSTLKEDAEVKIVDSQQNNEYNIKDIRTCEDRTSPDYLNFVDLVI